MATLKAKKAVARVVVKLRGSRGVFVLVFMVSLTFSVAWPKNLCRLLDRVLTNSLANDFVCLLQQTVRHFQSQSLSGFVIELEETFGGDHRDGAGRDSLKDLVKQRRP
jgi:hypothetical protein